MDWHQHITGMRVNSMIAAFYILILCSGIIVVVSYAFPEPLKDEAKPLVWEDWREPLRGEAHGRGLGNYRILSAVVLLTFLALYILFR